jgi:hypothetical protein
MKISVMEVLDGEPPVVAFVCSAGSAHGLWRGETAPDLGDYDVQFMFPAALAWGRQIRFIEAAMYRPPAFQAGCRMVGVVTDVSPENVLWIDLAGHVVMVESDPLPPADLVGATVELDVAALELYPPSTH